MASLNLTPRQLDILCAVIKEMKAEIDWEKVKETGGFTTAKYTRDQFAVIKNKLMAGAPTGDGEGTSEGSGAAGSAKKQVKKPTTPKKRKTTNADADDDEPASLKKGKKDSSSKGKATTPTIFEDEDIVVKAETSEAGQLLDDMPFT